MTVNLMRIKRALLYMLFQMLNTLLMLQEVNARDEDDNLLLERILLLIRNLLYIPADPDDEKVILRNVPCWILYQSL